jgi:hypothetical protein
MATAALIAVGTGSAGGLTVAVLAKLRRQRAPEQDEPEPGDQTKEPRAEEREVSE